MACIIQKHILLYESKEQVITTVDIPDRFNKVVRNRWLIFYFLLAFTTAGENIYSIFCALVCKSLANFNYNVQIYINNCRSKIMTNSDWGNNDAFPVYNIDAYVPSIWGIFALLTWLAHIWLYGIIFGCSPIRSVHWVQDYKSWAVNFAWGHLRPEGVGADQLLIIRL